MLKPNLQLSSAMASNREILALGQAPDLPDGSYRRRADRYSLRWAVCDGGCCGGWCRGNCVCAYKDLGGSYTSVYARVYVQLSAAPSAGDGIEILGFSSDGWLPNLVGTRLDIINNAGLLEWNLWYYNSSWQGAIAASISLNVWYCVEVKLVIGNGYENRPLR